MWQLMAVLSAFFGGITAIFSKIGLKKTDADVALALRTVVMIFFAWGLVFIAGSSGELLSIKPLALIYLVLAGFATFAAMLCYFKAISQVDVGKVAPIDKSSTILTVLAAIVIFGETDNLWGKLAGVAVMLVGIFLMLEKPDRSRTVERADAKKGWLFYAIISAIFTAATSILAKAGLAEVESNLATAIRTSVVLVFAFLAVFVKGKQKQIVKVKKRELLFIALSGISTGAAWLCYFYAIKFGQVSVVAPIDKLSLLVTVGFSYIVFREKLSKRALCGMFVIIAGLLLMSVF